MPAAFLLTLAPNGLPWSAYCGSSTPVLDPTGLVAGPWGECMHWAVVYEQTNKEWSRRPEYRDDGPAGQVLSYLEECGYQSFSSNLERNETATRSLLSQGQQTYAFQQMQPVPSQFGQPMGLGATPVMGVPAHPGAPGTTVVVGVPFSQRVDAAMQSGFPGKTSVDQVQKGADVLENNPHFPDHRPCRDVAWAGLFCVVCVALIGTLAYFAKEIPKQAERIGTLYETFPGATCNMDPISTWPNGESTQRPGITQRLIETTSRRLSPDGDDGDKLLPDIHFSSAAEIEMPGLTQFVRRLQVLNVPGSWSTLVQETVTEAYYGEEADATHGAAPRQLYISSTRRRRTQQTQQVPKDTDCERACAAFTECAGFDVRRAGVGVSTCAYQRLPSGGLPTLTNSSLSNIACWRKIDGETANSQANTVIAFIAGMAVLGAFISMIVALAFVAWAAHMPAAATYTGVYFVPGCMIFIGVVLLGISFAYPYTIVAGTMLGAILAAFGSCLCACTWCCYRDLIPFTIEVVAAVTSVILRFKSMFIVAGVGAIGAILWSFLVVGAALGIQSFQNRMAATTPSAELTQPAQYVVYIQYFLWCLVYYWGAFLFFNICHVAYCGVFGSFYFGKADKDSGSLVRRSTMLAVTVSFGSICFGSLIIAVIRAMEALMRKLRNDAEESGNTLACLIACVMEAVIGCIGDILEWISTYVYVQVAIRGLGFMDAARATYALAKVSNLIYVVSQMLCEWVSFMGAILAGLVGGVVAGLVGYVVCAVPDWCAALAVVGGILGLIAGCIAGGSAVGTINSGAATILMCWAEVPDVLASTQPQLHRKFEQKITRDGDC